METEAIGLPGDARPGGHMRHRTTLLVVGVAALIGLVEGTQVYLGFMARGRDFVWWHPYAATVPSWFVLAALLPGILFVARRCRLDRGSWARALLVHIPAAFVFAFLHLLASAYISDVLLLRSAGDAGLGALITRALSIYFVVDVMTYAGIVGAWYALDYYRMYRERSMAAARLELRATRLEASLAQANLAALRMQLNPHFLFNTLNAVSVLAMKGENEAVVRMLTRLSELLRFALDNTASTVRLEEELELLQRYLAIEQVRFQDRLTVETDVDPDALGAEVPSLLLQPLVENAIKHGLSARTGAGRITIRAHRDNGSLELQVADTGPGLRHARRGGEGGVGLANTRARLEQLYGETYRFSLRDGEDGGAVARVTIPFRLYNGQN